MIKRMISSVLLLLSISIVAAAQQGAYPGYVVQNVYWAAGFYNGYYYPAGYYPTYIKQQSTTINVNLPATPPVDWRNQVLKEFGRIEENKQYQQALAALRAATGQSSSIGYSGYQNLNASLFYQQGYQQGNTGFAQNFGIADLARQIDLEAADQRTAQLLNNLGTLFDNANKDRSDLLDKSTVAAAARLDRLTKAQALLMLSRSLDDPPKSGSVNIQASNSIKPTVLPPSSPLVGLNKNQITVLWQASAAKCLSCHGPQKQNGFFNVTKMGELSEVQQATVLARMDANCPEDKRMPRTKDGKAGEVIEPAEFNVWRTYFAMSKKK